MGIATETTAGIVDDWHAALAALAWQVDAGVDEVLLDAPINRYDLPDAPRPDLSRAAAGPAAAPPRAEVSPPAPLPATDPVQAAKAAATAAATLGALHEAIVAFDLCELKRGARKTVFADGNPKARVLILGEPPGAEEDREGRPFVGQAGQLLDRMFAAIGLSRGSPDPDAAFYITNILPWRPPVNRDPKPDEIAMMRPFVERHIALVDPAVIVVMGNAPLEALTGQTSILRARGTWARALGKPLLPMIHPTYLLKDPAAKGQAWADLLALQARLRG